MCYSKKGFDNICEKLDDTKITDLIKQLKPKHSQEKMCKIFKGSRVTYYFNLNKTTTKTQERYELLSSQIKRIYEENSNGSNPLKQDFSTTSSNKKTVGDITYIYTKELGVTFLIRERVILTLMSQ